MVEDIAGNGIIDSSRATLNFDRNERLRSRASCNSYTSHYELNGEQIEVDTIAAPLMACAPALNNQEDEFLKVLRNARSFEIDDTGKLIIRAESGDTLGAYPAG